MRIEKSNSWCRMWFGVLRILVDCVMVYAVVKGFWLGVAFCTDFLRVTYWAVVLYASVLGVALVAVLYTVLKDTAFFVLKNATIYSVCHEECTTVWEAFAGCIRNFKSMLAIPVFNKLVRKIVKEVQQIAEGKCEGSALSTYCEALNGNQLFRLGKRMVVKTFDLFDECILAYCYSHVETGLAESAVRATAIFLKNLPKLVVKATSISLLLTITDVFVFVLCFLGMLKWYGFHVLSLVGMYVVFCAIRFVLDDAVLQPMLMVSLIKTFLECDESMSNEGSSEESSDEGNAGADEYTQTVEEIKQSMQSVQEILNNTF